MPIRVILSWNWRSCKDIAKESNEWSVPGFVLTVIYKLLLNLLFLTMCRLLNLLLFSFFLWYFITSPFPIYPHPLIFNFFYRENWKRDTERDTETAVYRLNVAIGLLFYLKYDFHFYLRRILFPPSVQEFAEQVFSALNKIHSDVKHLSEVHVAIYSILFWTDGPKVHHGHAAVLWRQNANKRIGDR